MQTTCAIDVLEHLAGIEIHTGQQTYGSSDGQGRTIRMPAIPAGATRACQLGFWLGTKSSLYLREAATLQAGLLTVPRLNFNTLEGRHGPLTSVHILRGDAH